VLDRTEFARRPGRCELERGREESDVDGVSATAAERPADVERFVDLVTPEPRRRWLLLRKPGDEQKGLMLRGELTGAGSSFPENHLGATSRRTRARTSRVRVPARA
jgi:hypothetical protein